MLAVKLRSLPAHIGELLVATGAAGVCFTVTETVPTGPVGHPGTVALTEYVPVAANVTPARVGFCEAAV